MERDDQQIKWLPFVSFCSLLIVLCAIALWVFGSGDAIFGALAIVGVLMIFPRRASFIENYWDTSIALGTHKTFIVLALIVLIFIVFFVAPNYQIVKKNKPQ